jgi:hypothetical protein
VERESLGVVSGRIHKKAGRSICRKQRSVAGRVLARRVRPELVGFVALDGKRNLRRNIENASMKSGIKVCEFIGFLWNKNEIATACQA